MPRRINGSSAEKASSKMRTSGSTARARARPTRCCMPPLSWLGYDRSTPDRPTTPTSSRARSWRVAWSTPVDLEPVGDVVEDVAVRKQGEVLEDHAHLRPPQLAQRLRVRRDDVLPAELHRAAGHVDEPRDAAGERRLAAAREPHDHEDLAAGDVERDVAHRHDAPFALHQLGPAQVGHLRAGDLLGTPAEDLPDIPARDLDVTGARGGVAGERGATHAGTTTRATRARRSSPSRSAPGRGAADTRPSKVPGSSPDLPPCCRRQRPCVAARATIGPSKWLFNAPAPCAARRRSPAARRADRRSRRSPPST